MKRYKLPGGGLHSVPDDGSQDHTLTVDMVRISEAQFDAMSTFTNPPAAVPTMITMRQARLALLGAGLLDTVNAGVAGMPQAAQIEWEFASTVERSNPLITTLATALGLSGAQLDGLFTTGATL